ncbi:adenylate/guanylate cyclase domain-containing protein [Helicobacter cetorum]|uniref:Adenylate/guanylate cyclase n=1 Tax=Helicobacter cetorum (strain ATCC BAA-429 / MIT 00-7128) TaxID=182217 RepID=I0ENQ8_HELC0|nr:adenylate/guanylate cyclase domain-containing protein [Helicobacter cetorum]AFI04577.1 adenylate/guanylate cyclase [Helicobacter cetorum MIT 00-7128]
MGLEFIETLQSFEEYCNKPKMLFCESIPLSKIRLETDEWIEADNVACVFVDLENSTRFAINPTQKEKEFFAWYGDTLIRIFHRYETKYTDFQGDGGFALFDSKNSLKDAFDCAVTINHFFNYKHEIKVRIGIDIGTIYTKKVGVRGDNKEIWLGPVSIASKLCNEKSGNLRNMRISSRFYENLSKYEKSFFKKTSNFYHGGIHWENKSI